MSAIKTCQPRSGVFAFAIQQRTHTSLLSEVKQGPKVKHGISPKCESEPY